MKLPILLAAVVLAAPALTAAETEVDPGPPSVTRRATAPDDLAEAVDDTAEVPPEVAPETADEAPAAPEPAPAAAAAPAPAPAPDDEDLEVEEVEVVGRLETRSEAGQLVRRRRASAVSDAISAQEISRAADSNAGAAVRRVVSVTVEDDRYVFVRGLGGRYVTVRLNRFPLPSIEPDRPAVPFDLFPSAVLSTLNVFKTYTADLPGEFAGGTLDLETSYYPETTEVRARLSMAYSGGGLDFFGYDDGSRDLPAAIPRDRPIDGTMDAAALEAMAEGFRPAWAFTAEDSLPNLNAGISAGGVWRPGTGRLGYLVSAGFQHSDSVTRETSATLAKAGELELREPTTLTAGVEKATVSALLDVGYRIAADHNLQLAVLHAHTGEDEAAFYHVAESDNDDYDPRFDRRLRFVERGLTFGQLIGDHTLPALGHLRVRWQGNLSRQTSDEPDTRYLAYVQRASGLVARQGASGNVGELSPAALTDDGTGALLDLELPLGALRLLAGGAWSRTERSFGMRLFGLDWISGDGDVLRLGPAEIFAPEHLGSDFQLQETTHTTDAYEAEQTIAAGYAGAEWSPRAALRLIAGARIERTDLSLVADSPYGTDGAPVGAVHRNETDLLPAASAVYALSARTNLRAGYSYTLARPRFRELAPFTFNDYAARRSAEGTPELVTSRIHNADVRIEWFPADTEVVSLSGFHKTFRDPIELTINGNRATKPKNAASAESWGAELEVRSGLGRLAPWLRAVRAGANLALVWSRIELTPEQVGQQTNARRPMQGQAPYMANANLGYDDGATEVNVFYNVVGARVVQVGLAPMPDVYAQPVHSIDVSLARALGAGLTLKLSAKNLLAQGYRARQGEFTVLEETRGVSAAVGLEWRH
jgi:outer membrane receptor protein involved in Fe transport